MFKQLNNWKKDRLYLLISCSITNVSIFSKNWKYNLKMKYNNVWNFFKFAVGNMEIMFSCLLASEAALFYCAAARAKLKQDVWGALLFGVQQGWDIDNKTLWAKTWLRFGIQLSREIRFVQYSWKNYVVVCPLARKQGTRTTDTVGRGFGLADRVATLPRCHSVSHLSRKSPV